MNRLGQINQIRYYVGRNAGFDIDWGHKFEDKERGTVHLQGWNGENRTKEHRLLTSQEIAKFKSLVEKANRGIIQLKWS